MAKKIEMDNIIRITDCKHESVYAWSILIRCIPRNYNKFGCIKLQSIRKYLGTLHYLADVFCSGVGLMKKGDLKPIKIVTEKGVLPDAYEQELVKVPSIEYPDDYEA